MACGTPASLRSPVAALRKRRPETARAFGVSWKAVFGTVEWTVERGLKHRVLQGVRATGWTNSTGNGDGFLTVIYQIDVAMRRLL